MSLQFLRNKSPLLSRQHQKLSVCIGFQVIGGREIPDQLCLQRVGWGMNTGSNVTLGEFVFPTFCLDFQNHFLLKICATLFLSYKAFKTF